MFVRTSVVLLLGMLSVENLVGQAGQDSTLQGLRRHTPSGEYTDPASFFRFHGYVTLSYTESGADLGADPGATPQILVPGPGRRGTTQGGFRSDAALFVGGEPFENVAGLVEIHFVGNALDPVITEAKVTWDVVPVEPGRQSTFRLIAGRFWTPFGIHNNEWFSALNRFSLVSPAAAEAVPAHVNEVGVMAEGETRLGDGTGINWVASVGNGVPGFDLMPNVMGTGQDGDANRTVTGRLGFVTGSRVRVSLGASGMIGTMRDGEDPSRAVDDVMRYGADVQALGGDLSLRSRRFNLRSYLYWSREGLDEAPVSGLDRLGLTVEPSVTLWSSATSGRAVELVGRASAAREETLSGLTHRRNQFALGLLARVRRMTWVRVGYVGQTEGRDLRSQSNDAFSLGVTTSF